MSTRYLPVCISHMQEGADTTTPCVFCERDEARAEVKRLRQEHELLVNRLVQAERLIGESRALITGVAMKLM